MNTPQKKQEEKDYCDMGINCNCYQKGKLQAQAETQKKVEELKELIKIQGISHEPSIGKNRVYKIVDKIFGEQK